jgi:uncharacterized phage infection (PIP) family protein YhgE
MLKRPAEDLADTPIKKQRQNDDLESMKTQLDTLLKNAAEHHEERRIAAVDRAFDLEEDLKSAQTAADTINDELNQVSSDHINASQYLEAFVSSQTMKMLSKVDDISQDKVQLTQLKDDNEKIMGTLSKLKAMGQTLKEKQSSLEEELNTLQDNVQQIQDQYENAEKEVVVITNLNEP